jgi:hypothetical protein
MDIKYKIDNRDVMVGVDESTDFSRGEDICLAEEFDDLTRSKEWFGQGYAVIDSSDFFDHEEVKKDIETIVKRTISELSPDTALDGFKLEDYHKFVNDTSHNEIIKKTRRLFPVDFGFDESKIINRLSDYFDVNLGYRNRISGSEQWVITRINRPATVGFNPVHKDIYEIYDAYGDIPRMVNVWIPVCGVGDGTGLPVAPGSHLFKESEISRTKPGVIMEGQKYSVNGIKSWGGDVSLTTICPKEHQMIVFSSHLIHGLARNLNQDRTRISLEFRLYEQ